MSTLLFEALKERESTDRKMSFGKWFLFGIITLGIGFIFAFYYLIKRRTEHFKRQRKLEEGMIALLESRGAGESALAELKAIHGEARSEEKERDPILWVILSLIPFVSIYTLYFLTVDSGNHAMRQRRFTTLAFTTLSQLGVPMPQEVHVIPKRSFALNIVLTLVTLGIFGIYWEYTLFSDFNQHFEDHKVIEEAMLSYLSA